MKNNLHRLFYIAGSPYDCLLYLQFIKFCGTDGNHRKYNTKGDTITEKIRSFQQAN